MNSAVKTEYIQQRLQGLVSEIEPMLENAGEYIDREQFLAHGRRAMMHLKALSYALYEGLDYGEAGTLLDKDKQ